MSKATHLDAFGSTLEYFERGCDGPPVILLHCTGGSSAQWKALCAELERDHRVLAVNLYGYGGSSAWDGRAAFRLRHEAALIEELLLKLRDPAHLVGHSYGGSVALALARTVPEHVRSLSVFEPASFHLLRTGDPLDAQAFQEIGQVAETVWYALVSGEYAMGARYFVDYWSGCGAWSSLGSSRREALVVRLAKIGLDFQATVHDPAGLEAYRDLSMPRLIIQGERSALPAQRICHALAALWPDARHCVIEGVGHMGPLTHPGRINPLIAGFLREQRAIPPPAPVRGATSPGERRTPA